jgi:hypothetical protein
MSDDDFSANAGAGTTGRTATAPGKHRGPRFTWTPQFEATFFRSLCESVSLGLRDGSTFKPEAWERAMQALIEKHSAYANKSHLINKTDNARKKYRLWRGLREDPEFYYNVQTRTVTATEEAWARHLQVGICRLRLPWPGKALTVHVRCVCCRKSPSLAPSARARSSTKNTTRSSFPTLLAPAALRSVSPSRAKRTPKR